MVFYFFFLSFLLYIRAIIRAMSASMPKPTIAMLSAKISMGLFTSTGETMYRMGCFLRLSVLSVGFF